MYNSISNLVFYYLKVLWLEKINMRIYTIHKNTTILVVSIFLLSLITITLWLNVYVDPEKLNFQSRDYFHTSISTEVGFNFDDDKDDENLENGNNQEQIRDGTSSDSQVESEFDIYEGEEDDEENDNPVFRNGDFDVSNDSTQTTEITERKLNETFNVIYNNNVTRKKAVEDDIYWSEYLETQMPKGINEEELRQLQASMRNAEVQGLLPPSWTKCGRPKNQFISLTDGSSACARYRHPHHYLVDGEVLSFYLSRLLNISNVPLLVLSRIDISNQQWNYSSKIESAIISAGWDFNTTVALIQWISKLERSQMPKLIMTSLKEGIPITQNLSHLDTISVTRLVELMQWSDLIIFDYLTGNYDRVAYAQDTADKENRLEVFNETIHNLVRSRQTGKLWFIDNESGLLDSYSLLYSEDYANQGERFHKFHKRMLQTLCIFRRSTVRQLKFLHQQQEAFSFLIKYTKLFEPLFNETAIETTRYKLFIKYFEQRINEVNDWIEHCRQRGL